MHRSLLGRTVSGGKLPSSIADHEVPWPYTTFTVAEIWDMEGTATSVRRVRGTQQSILLLALIALSTGATIAFCLLFSLSAGSSRRRCEAKMQDHMVYGWNEWQ
ncbi:hypothetical protein PV04_06337 [Phialophora macrospora]|uniref:Uncharacterized protein n=1 Tax=Phialophora macrospora TaxID=1851006 RepID=A0A0D2CPI7_9EURO|nr:hypothetical protein PV04_06337 [Phialophora macrospora]